MVVKINFIWLPSNLKFSLTGKTQQPVKIRPINVVILSPKMRFSLFYID